MTEQTDATQNKIIAGTDKSLSGAEMATVYARTVADHKMQEQPIGPNKNKQENYLMRPHIALFACLIISLTGCKDNTQVKAPVPLYPYYCSLSSDVNCMPPPQVTMADIFR
ncbi:MULTISPECIES: hypothetical protein [unclassified Pseudomonas]|uniref:hypothetical protein n=1 Tax=unclassified Pseudomonas TaxID=196821 RepID=UPI0011134757|nr:MULTISPECIES: hypothetical protein [unclassified Pseudomonas]